MIRQVAAAVIVSGSLVIVAAPALAADTTGTSAGPTTSGSSSVSSTTGTTGASGTSATLPRTGNDAVVPGLAAGLGLLLAGTGLVVAGRRRPQGIRS
jgi:LPXTG-motif cell wall-anchored protein